jgi:hypothetical protein
MEGTTYWGTTNLKVAACVAAFGATLRQSDPVTNIVKQDGTRQVTFWFNAGTGSAEAKKQMECKWSEVTADPESPVLYVRAALENRETLLGLVKRAEPIQIISRGGQTLLVPVNAKPELKRAILRAM